MIFPQTSHLKYSLYYQARWRTGLCPWSPWFRSTSWYYFFVLIVLYKYLYSNDHIMVQLSWLHAYRLEPVCRQSAFSSCRSLLFARRFLTSIILLLLSTRDPSCPVLGCSIHADVINSPYARCRVSSVASCVLFLSFLQFCPSVLCVVGHHVAVCDLTTCAFFDKYILSSRVLSSWI